MFKTSRLFGLLTIVVMISLMLAACGQPATATPEVQPPAASAAPAATEVPTVAPTATPNLYGGVLSIGIANEPQTSTPEPRCMSRSSSS